MGKLKVLAFVRTPEPAAYSKELTEAIATIFGDPESDLVKMPQSAVESATARNEFKRAVLNHRKAIIIECQDDKTQPWHRFTSIAAGHKDIEFASIMVNNSGSKPINTAGIEVLNDLTPLQFAREILRVVTQKKQ